MENNSKIEKIREYFMKCPFLKDGVMNIDNLNTNETITYSINTDIAPERILKKYTDGGALMIYPFLFTSSEMNSQNIQDQIEANAFYEKLADWIESNNRKHILPSIQGCQYINIQSHGYLYNADETQAIYQIPLQLIYYSERR